MSTESSTKVITAGAVKNAKKSTVKNMEIIFLDIIFDLSSGKYNNTF